MQESEVGLVWDAFSSIIPYLAHPQELRDLLEKLLGEGIDIKAFSEQLGRAISNEDDSTYKTDVQIFINELRRRFQS
jgi:hypothetical protein